MNMKRKITQFFWFWHGFRKLFLKSNAYIKQTGWLNTLKRGYPCDKDGDYLPWMNYSIIAFLDQRLNKNLSLFEYGSGFSTMFYAKRVQQVTSLEYDQNWLTRIKNSVPDNATLVYQANDIDGEYCRAIQLENKKYDVVIVDGRDRVNCVKQGLANLSEQGVLILDDSYREKYQVAKKIAADMGYKALDFVGMKPGKYAADQSTLFYKDNNCLGL